MKQSNLSVQQHVMEDSYNVLWNYWVAWVGIQDAECIFLNNFRWSAQLIPWHDLLLMLEGEVVHLPAPKTHFTEDIQFIKDTSVFFTSKRPLIYIKKGVVNDRETQMMAVRGRVLYFNYQTLQEKQLNILPCKRTLQKMLCQVNINVVQSYERSMTTQQQQMVNKRNFLMNFAFYREIQC